MSQSLVVVVDVLCHLHVPFAATRAGVVEGVTKALQFILVRELVRHAAQSIPVPVPLAPQQILGQTQCRQSATLPQGSGQPAKPAGFAQSQGVSHLLLVLVDDVGDEGADILDLHLRPFPLEEAEHIEVAVALCGLRPEFTCDLDDGFDPRAIHLDLTQSLDHLLQAVGDTSPA